MAVNRRGIKTPAAVVILFLTLAVSLGAGFFVLSGAKKQFAEAEQGMPESTISAYLKRVKSGDFGDIYEESMIVEPHLNSREDYETELRKIYENIDMSRILMQEESGTDTDKQYMLVADKKVLARLHLKQNEAGKWMASTIFQGDHNYIIEVPAGLTLTVNGNEVASGHMIETGVAAGNYRGLADLSAAPQVDVYEIRNLLGEPEIGISGSSDYGVLKDVVSGHLLVGRKVNEAEIANAMVNAIKTCASYTAKDASLGDVAAVSVTSSDWYRRIRTMQNNWFSAHSSSRFFNEKAFDLIQQSETSVTGYVTFDYYAENSEVSRTWNAGYQMNMIRDGGTWKIAGLGVDSTLNEAKQNIE